VDARQGGDAHGIEARGVGPRRAESLGGDVDRAHDPLELPDRAEHLERVVFRSDLPERDARRVGRGREARHEEARRGARDREGEDEPVRAEERLEEGRERSDAREVGPGGPFAASATRFLGRASATRFQRRL
jgi:hypothetical protein